ncbi:hypothetical protein [Rhizobium phage RHph_X2_26]|nr:hypothetical protein [Rhizobium phage RHph_X2_26]
MKRFKITATFIEPDGEGGVSGAVVAEHTVDATCRVGALRLFAYERLSSYARNQISALTIAEIGSLEKKSCEAP